MFNLKIYELNLNLKMILNLNVLHHLSADVVVSTTSSTYWARIRIFCSPGSTTSYTTFHLILQDDVSVLDPSSEEHWPAASRNGGNELYLLGGAILKGFLMYDPFDTHIAFSVQLELI